jgi:hypothetical protein
MMMIGKEGGAGVSPSGKRFAVLALCLIAINSVFLVFAASGQIHYFVGFGIIPVSFLLAAFWLLIAVGRSRHRA